MKNIKNKGIIYNFSNLGEKISAILSSVSLLGRSKELGLTLATNIIIDYVVGGEVFHNYDEEKLRKYFNYYSWSPYFDGNYDIIEVEERFNKNILTK